MSQALIPHPGASRPAVQRLEVDVSRLPGGRLALRYRVVGDPMGLALPAPAAAARTDDLWRHTCFEAFLRPGSGEAYWEFNLSPSTQWAAYRFDGYRQGMAPAQAISSPGVACEVTGSGLDLRAALALNGLDGLAHDLPWRLGLSAVIEDAAGAISHWALAHPPGRPDFHHADGFVLDLPAPGIP